MQTANNRQLNLHKENVLLAAFASQIHYYYTYFSLLINN